MNTPTSHTAENSHQPVPVWDLPVRIGHWLLAGGVLLAFASGESESWRLLHIVAGVLAGVAAAYRIVWGLFGSRHARFASFVRGPAAVWRYLQSLLGTQPEHHTGHNPAGAWAIVALLGLALLTALTGAMTYWELLGSERLTDAVGELHEGLANTLIAVVVVHLGGVAVGSLLHRENLVRAMFTGRKLGTPGEARESNGVVAAVLLVVLAASAIGVAVNWPV